jgi:predicted short-subunit dehydrogenase-like oxidoreductase (DUF2520 family)
MIRAESEIKSVAFVGSGKVANGFASIFHQAGFNITGIYSRNKETGKALAQKVDAPFFDSLEDLKADLIFVAVADQHVIEVVNSFAAKQLVVYSAGSIALEDIENKKTRAVFYPLQSFTEGRNLKAEEIPILLEANTKSFQKKLEVICKEIGFEFQYCDSEKRKKIHLSAVFLNNFVNHLVYISQEEAFNNKLDWSLFQPLLNETFEKLKFLNPFEAQTGPAKRNDRLIIENQLSYLEGRNKEIYKLLSQSIIETYSKND